MSLADDLRAHADRLNRMAARLLTRAAYADCDEARALAEQAEGFARTVELAADDTAVMTVERQP